MISDTVRYFRKTPRLEHKEPSPSSIVLRITMAMVGANLLLTTAIQSNWLSKDPTTLDMLKASTYFTVGLAIGDETANAVAKIFKW